MENVKQTIIVKPKPLAKAKKVSVETNLTAPMEEVKVEILIHLSHQLGEALLLFSDAD